MSQADPEGPPDPSSPPTDGSGEAAIMHVGGPWYDVTVDGETERVRGKEAAEARAEGLSTLSVNIDVEAYGASWAVLPEPIIERFRGPAVALTLDRDPDPETVVVERHDGHQAPISVQGRQVTRNGGHFGRGRWTVRYQPR